MSIRPGDLLVGRARRVLGPGGGADTRFANMPLVPSHAAAYAGLLQASGEWVMNAMSTAAALLVLAGFAAGPATVHATVYDFRILHLEDLSDLSAPQPIYTDRFTGRFAGDDLDHDGVLRRDELSLFTLDGLRYLPAAFVYGVNCNGCLEASRLDGFSYSLVGGDLHASGYFPGYDYLTFDLPGDITFHNHGIVPSLYRWVEGTTTVVTVVPEPGSAGLMLGGLAAALIARRRVMGSPARYRPRLSGHAEGPSSTA